MNHSPWGATIDDNLNEDNLSRGEPKRSHQWFSEGAEAGLFPSKRQAMGTPSTNLFSEILHPTISPWSQSSTFQTVPGHFNERFFDPVVSRVACSDTRNSALVNLDRLGVGTKMDESLFINSSSSGLSMYCLDTEMECNYGGLRRVKVNQVKDADGIDRASLEQGYGTVLSNRHSLNAPESVNMPLGLGYSKGNDRIMSSAGNAETKNSIFVPAGQSYGRLSESPQLCDTYEQNHSILGMMQSFSKCDNISLAAYPFTKIEEKSTAMEHAYLNSDNGNTSIGHNRRGESTIISFGGYEDNDSNCSGRLLSTYELFASQPAFQISEADHDSHLTDPNIGSYGVDSQIASASPATISKRRDDIKPSKKASTNSFPSNVRSLLSTGMLDGVSVKYIAWSREKELSGIIKGSGYLCGCQTCNFSKVVNAYEFERHANCKTKHPNNHIYFENGKTIYGIVQELRSTPQNMLFDVMQTITGSPINQKSFRLWKESFQAAARELQRIYGKD